jgi:DNA-binding MarR family transcriptional regulator
MSASGDESGRKLAYGLSNNTPRLLREFASDWETRVYQGLVERGFTDLRPSHVAVFANLGMGAVRVTELAERAQVTQQAMGKMLKEIERLGYIVRGIDSGDKRAKEIRMTERGERMQGVALQLVEEIRQDYARRIGEQEFAELEERLRIAVGKLQLQWLPESWVDQDQPMVQ